MMSDDDDNYGQMRFGDLGGLTLPDIRLTGEEKPRKKHQRCMTGAHATTWPTAVDSNWNTKYLDKDNVDSCGEWSTQSTGHLLKATQIHKKMNRNVWERCY